MDVIANISSHVGDSVSPTAACHSTSSKVIGLAQHMPVVSARYNIRTGGDYPGTINSGRTVQRLEVQGRMEEVKNSIPLGRIGDLYEVTSYCLLLAPDLSAYVTGATLEVSKGSFDDMIFFLLKIVWK